MKRPSEQQFAIADLVDESASATAARLGVGRASILYTRRLVKRYRRWEQFALKEAHLPFGERKVEFLPLSRRATNSLRRAGIDTGAELLAITPEASLRIRSAGAAVWAEVRTLIEQYEAPGNE